MNMADEFFLTILGRLDEAQARWYVAREALACGRGGIAAMERLTGVSKGRILRGIRELKKGILPPKERVRRVGGGRKRLEQNDPELTNALEKIMGESTAGDPMSPLCWTHKSTRTIAEELNRQGHAVSHATVGHKLHELGYSMQSNRKDKEGLSPPERDRQFRYINDQVRKFVSRGDPVISVDAKKKEKVGEFKNPGKTWLPKGQPKKVLSKDFPNLASGTAIPYGAYDPERNEGFVNVGVSNETAEFAVGSIRRWWKLAGRRHYSKAKRLLICADAGGGNGSRRRGWKYHLQEIADEFGISVTVCHYPPGTSKWNKIEHRMFSFISMNWQGEPLVSYETILNLISGTRTRGGLRIKARLDTKEYEKGIEITDEQMESVNIESHAVHPNWNYTICFRTPSRTRNTKSTER
jgi:transposase